jgi:hypothetical protein
MGEDVSDPLRWWPGKYADCKRIAHLVEEFLPTGEVLECGGLGIFADLLPGYRVTAARLADGIDLCELPWEDDCFDVGVSARVIELLPPRLRPIYLRELLRVCRYRVFVALPTQPELEAIDKIKNAYVWDTSRVWQHPGPRPDELERAFEESGVEVTFHVEPPRGADIANLDSPSSWVESFLASEPGSTLVPGLPTPPFVVAEIAKAEPQPRSLVLTSQSAH